MFRTFSVLAGLVGVAAILSAQAIDPDTFKVSYFANNLETDSNTVRVTNVGTSGGNVCADIYVFDPNQELSECCSCLVTPDGLLELSVHFDLTDNPLTGVSLDTGAIKIVSAAVSGGACSLPTAPKPVSGVRAWATHLQNNNTDTETEFLDSGLSATELGRLGAQCKAIQLVGSGKGVCTCNTENVG
jgi:hypothetical protein